jgi:hypothetical protein
VGAPRPWRVTHGGTGFYPPCVKPKEGNLIGFAEDVPVSVDNRTYKISKETAERYLRALNAGRYQPPASVFCSRELENGLNAYVEECIMILRIPTDDDLRSKARKILGSEHTAAGDTKLLESFKAMHMPRSTQGTDNNNNITLGQQSDCSLQSLIGDMNMFAAYDQQMDAVATLTNIEQTLLTPLLGVNIIN